MAELGNIEPNIEVNVEPNIEQKIEPNIEITLCERRPLVEDTLWWKITF